MSAYITIYPKIEGYYQEIGRAGRDGLPSETILFESYGDVIQLQNLFQGLNAEVQLAKLDRMKQYADALSCRRKILLSYFGGELTEENCGNCDICKPT
jgi:ATP-dependent DNA helicase RecQ